MTTTSLFSDLTSRIYDSSSADRSKSDRSLQFFGWTTAAILLVIFAVFTGYRQLRSMVEERLDENVEASIGSVRTSLDTAHQLYSERVTSAMQVLRHLTAEKGQPSAGVPITVAGREAHDLLFGQHHLGLNFEIVDQTVELMGGTATLFALSGKEFVRISTNVKKDDGTRAIGTILDPDGPAFRALSTNQSFYGVVDILGRPYITAYEPIHNQSGGVIGIYYVGYRVETLDVIGTEIANSHLLENGSFVLLDQKGQPLFGGDLIAPTILSNAAARTLDRTTVSDHWTSDGWVWSSEQFPQWKLTLLAAVNSKEIHAQSLRSAVSVFGLMVPILTIALLVTFFGTRKLKQTLEQSERLKAEADRLSVVASRTHNSVIITDSKGIVEWVNDGFTRMTGFSASEILGHHPDEILPGEATTPESLETKNRARAEGRGFQQELRIDHKDGRHLWVLLDGQPMKAEDGTVTGYVVVKTDITKRKEEEVELRRAQEAADQANQAKSAFLANMSHELRTPLNAIIGYTEMLIERAEFTGQGESLSDLNKVESAGNHLLGLINDVLDLSKIEAGKMTLYLEDIPISKMIEEVAATIQPLITKNTNELVVECPPDAPVLHADVTKVRQTLFNLLSNAAKFTEEGMVRLRVRINNNDTEPRVAFEVADTGIGMNPEQLGRLFKAFSQADDSTTRKFGGTGLGLVISRRFCQLMGGDITVTSEPGEGTTFTATIPLQVQGEQPLMTRAPFPDQSQITPSTAGPSHPDAPLILIVDDDPTTIDLLSRNLVKEGYAVISADNGIDALALARTRFPRLITLDVMMPSMDGWSVLSTLKADPKTQDIPVVMVSMVDDLQLGYTLGAADYLTKPVDRSRLVAALNRHVTPSERSVALIIDDLADNRTMLNHALTQAGWTAVEAEDGLAGLEAFAEHQPQLILLDLMMPEMDGFEFIRILRQRPDGKDVPVIVVTAKDLSPEERESLRTGVENVIQKSAIAPDGLLAEIRDKITNIHPHET